MPIEVCKDGTVVATGEGVTYYRLMVMKSMLKLEIKGMKRRGRPISAIIKEEFKLKGRTKADILAQFEEYIRSVEKKLADR